MKFDDFLKEEEKSLIAHKELEKGTVLFREGQRCEDVYFVESGRIRMVHFSREGEEELLSEIREGEFFANALIFAPDPFFLGDVVVSERSRVACVRRVDLLLLMRENREFLEFYMREIALKTIRMTQRTKLLSFHGIRARILHYLELNRGSIEKNVTELAKVLVLPRPSVSRELSRMKEEGVISESRGFLFLKNKKPPEGGKI